MPSSVLTLIVALIGGCGSSIVVGLVTRPKTLADAGQARATGEVALSADARSWAEQFRQETNATKAELGACNARLDDLEERFALAIDVIRDQAREIVTLGGHPSPYPPRLVPPLPALGDPGPG